MDKFSIFQRNNLITGVPLSAELQPSRPEYRSFIIIRAYIPASEPYKRIKIPKILNANHDQLRFQIKKYEISLEDLNKGWDSDERDWINYIVINYIVSIDELEIELSKYIGDFSILTGPGHKKDL